MAGDRFSGIFTIDAEGYLSEAQTVAVEQLGDGLWAASCGDYRSLFAEGNGGVVAFNTLSTPAAARAVQAEIEATLPGRAINTLVLTIDHLDHTGYGAELAPDAEVVGHELAARVIRGREASGPAHITKEVSGKGEAVELDGVRVELVYPGPTQGTGNLAAYLPDQRVLFLVGPRADARYGLFADYHLARYTDSVRSLLGLDFDTVVPGRGELMDRAGLERGVDYVEALKTVCQEAFAGGQPIWILEAMQAYVAERLADQFGDLAGFDRHVGIGAIRVVHHYVMGGWGLEDTHEPERLLATG